MVLHQLNDDPDVVTVVLYRNDSHNVGRIFGIRILAVFVGQHKAGIGFVNLFSVCDLWVHVCVFRWGWGWGKRIDRGKTSQEKRLFSEYVSGCVLIVIYSWEWVLVLCSFRVLWWLRMCLCVCVCVCWLKLCWCECIFGVWVWNQHVFNIIRASSIGTVSLLIWFFHKELFVYLNPVQSCTKLFE